LEGESHTSAAPAQPQHEAALASQQQAPTPAASAAAQLPAGAAPGGASDSMEDQRTAVEEPQALPVATAAEAELEDQWQLQSPRSPRAGTGRRGKKEKQKKAKKSKKAKKAKDGSGSSREGSTTETDVAKALGELPPALPRPTPRTTEAKAVNTQEKIKEHLQELLSAEAFKCFRLSLDNILQWFPAKLASEHMHLRRSFRKDGKRPNSDRLGRLVTPTEAKELGNYVKAVFDTKFGLVSEISRKDWIQTLISEMVREARKRKKKKTED